MLRIFAISLITVASQPASAHVPDGQEGLLTSLVHQVAATHHLPVTLLVIAIGILAVRGWRTGSDGR